ncbi:hypothetical protein GIB67_007865 [Kingdonia uniflora]|uniref:Uncharacterized protein n=1 Tax=Kingdonia uniflora TaxID=39325 RepID=A0A7J7KW44_9MAGN|nr:hypothetical protein GIB67_007865 [Kingdonia uniflora]
MGVLGPGRKNGQDRELKLCLSGAIPHEIGVDAPVSVRTLSIRTENRASTPISCGIAPERLLFKRKRILGRDISIRLDVGLTLPNLIDFSVARNHFTGLIPVSLFNASGLVTVQLTSNNFTGPVPSSLGHLQSLEKLSLGDNNWEARMVRGRGNGRAATNHTVVGRGAPHRGAQVPVPRVPPAARGLRTNVHRGHGLGYGVERGTLPADEVVDETSVYLG